VHVQHPAKVPGLPEPEGADGDVRLNMLAVVIVSRDLANVAVASGQEQLSPVLADRQGGMAVPLEPHRPEGFGTVLIHPVGVRTRRGPEVDVERHHFLVPPQGSRRRRDVEAGEFLRNDVRSHRCQVRSVSVHRVEPEFRDEHDMGVCLHPGFRADDAYLFGNPSQRSARRRVALNHPQAPRRAAEHVVIQAGNQGGGPSSYVGSQAQLKRQCPLSIGGIRREVEVAINPLPAHVDRVVLPGEAQPVAVDGPEGAVRRNRSGHGSKILDLPRLGVKLRDAACRYGEDLLLACDQEAGGRGRCFADDDGVLILVGDDVSRFIREVSHRRGQDAVVERLDG